MLAEEKQAISKLRESIEYDKKHRIETIYDKEQIEFRNNIELMLNLVEKLQKENEELKEKDNSKYYHTINSKELENEINNAWKNKIREKINELEENIDKCLNENQSFWTDYSISLDLKKCALQELLEEE